MIFKYTTKVNPEWIDYNGHMQDAFYGLVFSYAVDALQDEVGFDQEYRSRTGCTIYLVEDHRFYLEELYSGDQLHVETHVLDVDEKRFHLYLAMQRRGELVAVCEFIELHVCKNPKPKACAMPSKIRKKLESAKQSPDQDSSRRLRSRALSLR